MTETSLPITTDRLILRRFQSADMAAYGDYHRREEVYRFLYSSPPSAEAMEAEFSDLLSALSRRTEIRCDLPSSASRMGRSSGRYSSKSPVRLLYRPRWVIFSIQCFREKVMPLRLSGQ